MKLLLILSLLTGLLFLTVGIFGDNRGALGIAVVFLGLGLLAFAIK